MGFLNSKKGLDWTGKKLPVTLQSTCYTVDSSREIMDLRISLHGRLLRGGNYLISKVIIRVLWVTSKAHS